MVAEELEHHGVEVALDAGRMGGAPCSGYDAAIVGGALYASRWHKAALAASSPRNVVALRRIPVWMFSSGPLDDSADRESIPPVKEVAGDDGARRCARPRHLRRPAAGRRQGLPGERHGQEARRRLAQSGEGAAWAAEVAEALPRARPGAARASPPASPSGGFSPHGAAGWALCAAAITGFGGLAPRWLALALHALAAPVVFAAVSYFYFRAPGARPPLAAALGFTVVVAALDAAVVAQYMLRSFDMFGSITGTWLPFALIFLATWATGAIMAMLPEPGARKPRRARAERPSMLSGPPAAGTP